MRKENDLTIRDLHVKKLISKNNYKPQLFHYTTMDALYGITKNRELWLGSLSSMNDQSEITDFLHKLQEAVSQNITNEKKLLCDNFFTAMYCRLENEYPFAMSFSELSDNAAQWERYAKNATGACVVFNTSAIMKLFTYNRVLFNRVFYSYDICNHAHYKILSEYFNDGILSEFQEEKSLVDNILACGYLHKHSSFETEREIRMVTLWGHKINHSDIHFELINNQIRKILKVSLNDLCTEEGILMEELIDEIVIGPRASQGITEMREFLKSINLNIKVSESTCPLRR